MKTTPQTWRVSCHKKKNQKGHYSLAGKLMDRIRTSAQAFVSRITTKRLLLAGLMYWLPILVFAKLSGDILDRDSFPFEISFLKWLHQASTPALDQFAVHATNLGDFLAVIIITLLGAALLLRWGRRIDATALVFGVGGAVVLNVVLKFFFQRPRPMLWHQIVDSSGYSFPSGHAMMSSALAVSVIIIAWKSRLRYLVLALGASYVVVVGLSRMYLGVHFPTDIAAGWCVSLVWVLIVHQVLSSASKQSEPTLLVPKQP
jgi:membrane-associated phospholipid phosphatase